MSSKSFLPVAVLVCLACIGWLLLRSGGGPAATEAVAGAGALGAVEPVDDGAELAEVGVTTTGAGSDGSDRAVAAPALAAAVEAHPWAGLLAGVTGRIVEEDGTPIPALPVELLQVDFTSVFAAEARALGNDSIELAETTTDDEGRFVLEGATVGSFHLLGIDRGGGRSTIRLVEKALESKTRTDLGDIVLRAAGVLVGTVIDEDGELVEGARVRAAAIPQIVTDAGVLDLRKDSAVAFQWNDTYKAIDLPRVVSEQLDRLPVATTYSGADGSFRLEGVPLGTVVGGADHPGCVAAVIPATTISGAETDIGELELTFGRTLTGRVIDQAGDPVAGAEVMAGALSPLLPAGVMQPAGRTDADGIFSLRGIPEMGAVLAFARRDGADLWVCSKQGGNEQALDVVLSATAALTVRVVDEAGAPVSGAEVSMKPADEAGFDREAQMMLSLPIAERVDGRRRPDEIEPGTYVDAAVPLGRWRLTVKSDGSAPAHALVEVRAGGTLQPITCRPGRTVRVRVVDASNGEPVARAHASITGPSGFLFGSVGAGWTDEAGAVRLGPFAPVESLPERFEGMGIDEFVLNVAHPAYGAMILPLPANMNIIEVPLPTACTLLGRVHWGGNVPDRLYTIMLVRLSMRDMAAAFALPRIALSDTEGRFQITGLAPGDYQVHVTERFFDSDPMTLMVEQKEPEMRLRQAVQIAGSGATEVDLDLSPTGLGPTGRLTGSVTCSGQPVAGAQVRVRGGTTTTYETDASGRFDAGELSTIRGYAVEIEAEVSLPDGSLESRVLYDSWVQLRPDEVKELEIAVDFQMCTIEVLDARSGGGIEGANVSLQVRGESSATTGRDGRAELLLPGSESYTFVVSCKGYAVAQGSVPSADERDDGPLRVELVPPVPCAGRLVAAPGAVLPESGWVYLSLQSNGGHQLGAQIEPGDWTFSIENAAPGIYSANVWSSMGSNKEVEVEIPDSGVTDLQIVFAPKSPGDW